LTSMKLSDSGSDLMMERARARGGRAMPPTILAAGLRIRDGGFA
jgi:hypothetical protein